VVLDARASEFERDLPYALWSDAIDWHVRELGERRVRLLGVADPGALAMVAPALDAAGSGGPAADRHRTHRALRDLLERLSAARPLVLCLDDVHWADPASLDTLAALVRRPPAAAVLLALAAREGQLPVALSRALAAAMSEDRAARIALGPLSGAEAGELIGADATALFSLSGGNPFYLQQLARAQARGVAGGVFGEGAVPVAVAASLASELGELAPDSRLLLEAAAVLGDPFEPDLAAEVAELGEGVALGALDELLARALVRSAGVPRRFAFRHPLVRHAVYAAVVGGWRLAAHGRAADALARRGADVIAVAHHLERCARTGDEGAIVVLMEAAEAARASAPAIASRFCAGVLRLLPAGGGDRERRARMQAALADAQSAAGDPAAARATLADALRGAEGAERLGLTVAATYADLWLGRPRDARRRLQVALRDVPAQPSRERIRLRLSLGMTALFECDLREAEAQASDALDDARRIADPVLTRVVPVLGTLARVADARAPMPGGGVQHAAGELERLSGELLARDLPRALGQQHRSRVTPPVRTRDEHVTARHNRRRSILTSRQHLVNEAESLLCGLPLELREQLPASKAVRPRLAALARRNRRRRYDAPTTLRLRMLDDYRAQIAALDREENQVVAELRTLVRASGSTLGQLCGLDTRSVAELLVETGDPRRFTDGGFARFNGSAPLAASTAEGPGEPVRHRQACRAGARGHCVGCGWRTHHARHSRGRPGTPPCAAPSSPSPRSPSGRSGQTAAPTPQARDARCPTRGNARRREPRRGDRGRSPSASACADRPRPRYPRDRALAAGATVLDRASCWLASLDLPPASMLLTDRPTTSR